MPYFTSWDVNTYLSLLSWGLPEDVVKRMMKMTKEVHREFSLSEALTYWNTNSPMLDKMVMETRLTEHAHIRGVNFKFQINDILEFPQTRLQVFKRCYNMKGEFKKEWKYKSVEDRYDYYVWAYENFWYKSWNIHPSKKLNGFHPGRLFLMNLKKEVHWGKVRDLGEDEAWKEERFIRRKKYIDDMFLKV